MMELQLAVQSAFAQPKPPGSDHQTRSLIRARLVLPRKLFGSRSGGNEKAVTSKASTEPTTRKTMNTDTTSARSPRGKKKPTVPVAKIKAVDQELVDGYQPLSPSLLQERASLLRDLEEEMVREAAANTSEPKAIHSLDQHEFAAAEPRRPVLAHRRAKSTSVSINRSVRVPFARQASRNSAGFKLQSASSRGPVLPSEEEKKPARLGSGRGAVGGGDETGSATGGGVQVGRIRSLRRRGGGGASTGFVVPAVSLRRQKTLEKKRGQRLYNDMIEETAGRLVKIRRSRVKALVGAFESVISRIAK